MPSSASNRPSVSANPEIRERQQPSIPILTDEELALEARMTPTYRIIWIVCRTFVKIYFRVQYLHEDRVPGVGSVILAANHASFADPTIVGCGIRRAVNYLARETLFDIPGVGWVLRNVKSVPVDLDGAGAAGLKGILNRLHKGGAILLFPEGTRSHTGAFMQARSGIGLTVIRSKAPVIPIGVFGAYEAWNRHLVFPRPYPITIKYGLPLSFEAKRAEARSCSKLRLKEIYQEIADELMSAIAKIQPSKDIERFP